MHNDGTFVPGRIIGIQEVNLSSTIEKNNGEDWEVSVSFSSVAGAKRYLLIPKEVNYGIFISLEYSGNTISARIRNVSGGVHTLGAKVYVLALNM